MDQLPDRLPTYCISKDGDILLSLTGNVGGVCLVYDGPFLFSINAFPSSHHLKPSIGHFRTGSNAIMKKNEHSLKSDLHVHSPASVDYLGTRSVRGYAEWVKAFVDEEVDAIAITDHNTMCRRATKRCSSKPSFL